MRAHPAGPALLLSVKGARAVHSAVMIMQLVAVSCASPPTGRFDGVPAEDVELTLSFGAKLNMTGGAYGWKGPTPCTGSVRWVRW